MLFDRFDDTALRADPSREPLAAGTTAASNTNTVVAYPYTGDYRVDVLLDSDTTNPDYMSVTSRWNYGSPLGTPPEHAITYSFMTSAPSYGGNNGNNGGVPGSFGFRVFTPEQKQVTQGIFTHLSAELGIKFVEVPESGGSFGQIRLGQNDESNSGTAGYTYLPNTGKGDDGVAGLGLSGDVWLDFTYGPNYSLTPGGEGLETLVHEIGHAMGLKHPGDYNGSDGASSAPGNYLGTDEDNVNYTVMSYFPDVRNQYREWYGQYDLLALKALYGADSTFHAGPDTYSYVDGDGCKFMIIDDASGSDTVDLSALTLGATIDLRPGAFSSIGRDKGGQPAVNNLSIDWYTHIENVTGTNYADHIILGAGTASANGNAGIDTVQYLQNHAAYSVTSTGLGSNLHVTAGAVDDSLTGVERLQFADGKFAFDFNGNAGNTLKIMGAALGQGAHPDPLLAGLGLAYLDSGTSYADLMQGAINYELGAAHTHEAFVNLVFANVVGVAPSPDQLAFWVGELDAGHYTEANLAVLAADTSYNLARIDFTGQAQHGLVYT